MAQQFTKRKNARMESVSEMPAEPVIDRPRVLVASNSVNRARELLNTAVSGDYAGHSANRFDDIKATISSIDVVVMELELSDIDGIELIRYLGQQVNQPELIFSSNLDHRILSAAKRLAISKGLHVRAILNMPADPEALADALAMPPRSTAIVSATPIVLTDHQHLRRGLAGDEFVVHFQPKIDVKTLELVSVEALVRWQHPDYGLLPPASFVGLAEKTGLISPLTEAVVE
ncbi:MAG: EAL domain-containing protein, partial [Gammaproteobacteria bacterium]|nr:EAL domain-containing protein [Gammaproteobacteria bacterium]